MVKTKANYIIIILATLIVVFSGAIHWSFQFFSIGIVFFFSTTLLLKHSASTKNDISKMLLLIFPFCLFYAYVIFSKSNPNLKVLPILFIPIISTVLGYIYLRKAKRNSVVLIYIFLIIILSFIGMPNWINFMADDENPISKPFPELAINDINDQPFTFIKNKIIVLDLWSTSCGVCIEEFPDFEKLKLKYKNDERVYFYTLNLPLKRDSIIDVKGYIKKYKFKSLFSTSIDSWQKLENKSVPKLLILDKSMTIVYKGGLNDKWYEFYNNIDSLIEKYINE